MSSQEKIKNISVDNSEDTLKILIYDILIPLSISAIVFLICRNYVTPKIFEKLYDLFDLGKKPIYYHYTKIVVWDYLHWFFAASFFVALFCIQSWKTEFVPGPGRLARVYTRRFSKRTEFSVEEEEYDLSFPPRFDFKGEHFKKVMDYLKGKIQIEGFPWKPNPSSMCLGYFKPFEEKNRKYNSVILEPSGRNLHAAVIGASGSGKSVSIVGPTLAFDSSNPQMATFTLNPKGDIKLKSFALVGIHKEFRETEKFVNGIQLISFHDPTYSLGYDPFLFDGKIDTSLNITNKLCESMVWANPFYKTKGVDFVSKFASIMTKSPKLQCRLTLQHLTYYMRSPQKIDYLRQYIDDPTALENLNALAEFRPEDLSGIYSHLSTFVDNEEISHIFNDFSRPFANPIGSIQEGGNIFVEVDTISKSAVSKAFGKMMVMDLQILAAKRDNGSMSKEKTISVNLDEFGSFAYPGFIDFLDKGRSSNNLITLAFQDTGNLQKDGLPANFKKEVLANTSNKFFFKLADQEISEYGSEMMGKGEFIRKNVSHSASTNTLGDAQTGGESISYSHQEMPYATPAEFMNLEKGQAFVRLVCNDKPVAGLASIGLFPDDDLPTEKELRYYVKSSFEESFKHPGFGKILPITESYDPHGKDRVNENEEKELKDPLDEIPDIDEDEIPEIDEDEIPEIEIDEDEVSEEEKFARQQQFQQQETFQNEMPPVDFDDTHDQLSEQSKHLNEELDVLNNIDNEDGYEDESNGFDPLSM